MPSSIVLVPGQKEVPTKDASVVVAPMRLAGNFQFIVRIVDDAGLEATASVVVTVRPG